MGRVNGRDERREKELASCRRECANLLQRPPAAGPGSESERGPLREGSPQSFEWPRRQSRARRGGRPADGHQSCRAGGRLFSQPLDFINSRAPARAAQKAPPLHRPGSELSGSSGAQEAAPTSFCRLAASGRLWAGVNCHRSRNRDRRQLRAVLQSGPTRAGARASEQKFLCPRLISVSVSCQSDGSRAACARVAQQA